MVFHGSSVFLSKQVPVRRGQPSTVLPPAAAATARVFRTAMQEALQVIRARPGPRQPSEVLFQSEPLRVHHVSLLRGVHEMGVGWRGRGHASEYPDGAVTGLYS